MSDFWRNVLKVASLVVWLLSLLVAYGVLFGLIRI